MNKNLSVWAEKRIKTELQDELLKAEEGIVQDKARSSII